MFSRIFQALSSRGAEREADTVAVARSLFASAAGAGLAAPMVFLKRDGSVVAANDTAPKLGIGRTAGEAIAPHLEKAFATGQALTGSIPADTPGVAAGVWEIMVVPMVDEGIALVFGRDVAHEQALRNALVDSRRRYKDLVEISSDFAWETGADGGFVFVSPAGALGRPATAFIENRPEEFLVAALAAEAAPLFATKSPVSNVDIWMSHADGSSALILASAMPVLNARGEWCGARGICRDVTAERERDVALAGAETHRSLIAYIVRTMRDDIDPSNMLVTAASAVSRALGGSSCRIYRVEGDGKFVLGAEHGDHSVTAEAEDRLLGEAAEGEDVVTAEASGWHLMGVATSYRKTINGGVVIARPAEPGPWSGEERGLFSDVAVQLAVAIEQLEFHHKLEALSRTDELTGLLNRRAFFAELEARLSRMAAGGASGSLFFVDLDNFKSVNDMHGHQRGDEALMAVAQILVASTRPGDLVARLGGDEFALWLDRTDDASAATRAGELLRSSRPLQGFSGSEDRPLGVSIGIAIHAAGSGEAIAALIARADTAMYDIKHGSKGGFVIAPPVGSAAAQGDEDGSAGAEAIGA